MKEILTQTDAFTIRGLVGDAVGLLAICVLFVVGRGLPALT